MKFNKYHEFPTMFKLLMTRFKFVSVQFLAKELFRSSPFQNLKLHTKKYDAALEEIQNDLLDPDTSQKTTQTY